MAYPEKCTLCGCYDLSPIFGADVVECMDCEARYYKDFKEIGRPNRAAQENYSAQLDSVLDEFSN